MNTCRLIFAIALVLATNSVDCWSDWISPADHQELDQRMGLDAFDHKTWHQALELIEEHYAGDVRAGFLASAANAAAGDGSSRGRLHSVLGAIVKDGLDPHSRFRVPSAETPSLSAGAYGFIKLEIRTDSVLIDAVLAGSPADRAGLRPGDMIISIGGQPTAGSPNETLVRLLAGNAAGELFLTLGQPKAETVVLRAETLQWPSVFSKRLSEDILYLRIAKFVETTDRELISAIEGMPTQAIVLDLRFNRGGDAFRSVIIASAFLKSNQPIVQIKTKGKNEIHLNNYWTNDQGEAVDGPFAKSRVAVLVNDQTASGGELVAAALQDGGHDLIGGRTYGKGSYQRPYELQDGSSLKLTRAHFYSPNGRKIHLQGVGPNFAISSPENALLERHLDREFYSQGLFPVKPLVASDVQLQWALEFLRQSR